MVKDDVYERIVELCEEIAGGHNIAAACLYGSRVCGYARDDSDYDVLLVLEDYPEGVRYHYRKMDGAHAALLVVDKGLLEMDARKGGLGEFVAGRLIAPYTPISNRDYLWTVELEAKRRIAEEEIEDLVVEYGELARGLIVRPEYLALVRMRKRARVYTPLRYSYNNMLRGDLREKNMGRILDGYRQALEDLAESGIVRLEDGGSSIGEKYIDRVLSRRVLEKVVNILELSRRALYSYITHGKAGYVNLDVVSRELSSKLRRELKIAQTEPELEDPRGYLFLKTDRGLVSLSERVSIMEAVRRLRGGGKIAMSPLAGVLNEVFLIRTNGERLVAKRFTDWYSFKWFYLNLVALGTRAFELSGRARLANEYGTNRLLAENGIPVPEIVFISPADRLLIQRYVEGKNVLDLVREAFSADKLSDEQTEAASDVGRTVARIHALKVGIGDCKPENFIRGVDGKVYTLDLEQGAKMGDTAWDVAEFLYYAGHYGNRATGGA
ncbi:MAG: phosphotransferase, partial [Candidatus Bathyarchaeia archaeon]